jgi:hypothetical protein
MSKRTVAPPLRIISIEDEVVKMFNVALKMGGNSNHFRDGGVLWPRRMRWWGRMIRWDNCRGGLGVFSSGRER